MTLYELINPSDPYTFRASSDAVAAATVLLLGRGAYGAKREDGESVSPLLLFANAEQTNAALRKALGTEDLAAFVEAHRAEVADALDSFMSFKRNERRAYDEAMALLEGEARETYRARIHDANRSSLTDIGDYAWNLAKALRAAAP